MDLRTLWRDNLTLGSYFLGSTTLGRGKFYEELLQGRSMGHVAPRRHSHSARLPRCPDRPAPQVVALIRASLRKTTRNIPCPMAIPISIPKPRSSGLRPSRASSSPLPNLTT